MSSLRFAWGSDDSHGERLARPSAQQNTPTFANGRPGLRHPPEEFRVMLEAIVEPIVV
jgi:hypothetical protein